MEVEQHRFVEEPVNPDFGVAPAIAGSSGKEQKKKKKQMVRLFQGED